MTTAHSQFNQSPASPVISITASNNLWHWLSEQQISLAFTTYQSNRLFLVGCQTNGRLAINERLFDKPMGLYRHEQSLYMACRYQIWQFNNRLKNAETYRNCDALYFPSQSFITGDLNVHDIVLDKQQRLTFVNTDFSCIATLHPDFHFEPIWQPPFIRKLVAEDRCHLNGLALQNGEPTYVTACSATDEAAGWRKHRLKGGIVIHIPSNEIIASGLSMPHSPRWYQNKLWLLNSGTGELGYLENQRFCPIAFCPGFVRGLAFFKNYAVVGLSKLRSKTFSGLQLETRLATENQTAQCGLRVIDLNSGQILHELHINGVVEELFDVVILPKIRLPKAIGLQNDEIERLVTFPQSGGIVTTKPTVQRPRSIQPLPIAGLPRSLPTTTAVQYQKVYHLTPENLLPYNAMTYPNLQARWQTQAQRGELLGVSASIAGEMVGLIIAEHFSPNNIESVVEIISLFVLPDYRQQGIATHLKKHLQQLLSKDNSQ